MSRYPHMHFTQSTVDVESSKSYVGHIGVDGSGSGLEDNGGSKYFDHDDIIVIK